MVKGGIGHPRLAGVMRQAGIGALLRVALASPLEAGPARDLGHVDDDADGVIGRGRFGLVRDPRDEIDAIVNEGGFLRWLVLGHFWQRSAS